MCGRYVLTEVEKIPDLFEVDDVRIDPKLEEDFRPRFNVAPTQNVPAIVSARDGKRVLTLLRWGLVPFWAKDPSIGARFINARSETLAEKAVFRESFSRRRCIIPADGFFEWRKQADGKQPFLFRLTGGRSFGFAGLWASWKNPDGQRLLSCSIATTDCNELVKSIHDRMPVILHGEDHGPWLDPSTSPDRLGEILKPFPESEMETFPVNRTVNNVKNDSAECLRPLEASRSGDSRSKAWGLFGDDIPPLDIK